MTFAAQGFLSADDCRLADLIGYWCLGRRKRCDRRVTPARTIFAAVAGRVRWLMVVELYQLQGIGPPDCA